MYYQAQQHNHQCILLPPSWSGTGPSSRPAANRIELMGGVNALVVRMHVSHQAYVTRSANNTREA